MAITPEDPTLDAVSVTLQLAVPAEVPGTSLHGEPVKIALTPVCEKLTVPLIVSILDAVEGCSVTVAVHVDVWFTLTGVQLTFVEVVLRVTLTVAAGLVLDE